MTREYIQNFLKSHPEMKHRSQIPKIVEMLTGVPSDKQVAVKVAIRRLQEEIPNDEFGRKKEQEWRAERGMESIHELAEKVFVINGQEMRVKQ